MSKTSIKVQYVNQPKSPKGPGSVKTDSGVYYKVWKDLLPQFESGKTYEIEYDTEQYNGQDKYVARKILSSSESTNGHAGVSNSSPTFVESIVRPESDRSARIERQAALKVAAVVLSAQVQAGKSDPTLSALFGISDEIIAYIDGNLNTPAAAPVEQEVEI